MLIPKKWDDEEIIKKDSSINSVLSWALKADEKYLNDQKKVGEMLKSVINDLNLQKQIRLDFSETLKKIGYDENKINEVMDLFFQNIANWISAGKNVFDIEKQEYDLLKSTWVSEKFRWAQKDRVRTICEQIWHMIDHGTEWVDYGTGHWEVWKTIKDQCNCKITEVDVVDYRVPEVKNDLDLNFEKFDGYKISWNKTFDFGILTNVAHHEEDNEKIIKELTKRIKNILAVIETVPNLDAWNFSKEAFVKILPEAKTWIAKQILQHYINEIAFDDSVSEKDSKENIENARKRNHASDRRRNRVVTEPMNKVPVPWTYEHRLGWLIRFANHWRLPTEITDYGYDMRWLKDKHVGYKFIKSDSLDNLPTNYTFSKFEKNNKRQNAIEK